MPIELMQIQYNHSRIDPITKAKWVKALRSDQYKQSKEALRTDDGYCCLGVLCDIIDSKGWEQEGYKGPYKFKYKNDWEYARLSSVLANDMGLPYREIIFFVHCTQYHNASLTGHVEQVTPINMNDNGFTFSQIADMIEHFL